jgi:hypothetical protein
MNPGHGMRARLRLLGVFLLLTAPLLAQGKRLWVLRSPNEMVEYDPATFVMKKSVKVPAEAVQSPQNISINNLGQILFSSSASLPLSQSDLEGAHKIWFWNGQTATTIDQGVKGQVTVTGSNQAVAETAPAAYLAADGLHLFWFANEARRMTREDLDLSTTTTWNAWRTDLAGGAREDIGTSKFPDCRCSSGSCEESCPYGQVWTPEGGVDKLFVMTQLIAGKGDPEYKASIRYQESGGKWTATPQTESLKRVLDATPDGKVILEAIPDTGCCGWSNQSNDQTLAISEGKTRTLFDEQATYKNPDYDVSFSTSNALFSPDLSQVAMTIIATGETKEGVQLAQDGQANPEESKQIRKAALDLPAVEVKNMEDTPQRVAFLPHATLVGWISEKELLIVEDHLLVVFNLKSATRRKSSIRVDDPNRVFLR